MPGLCCATIKPPPQSIHVHVFMPCCASQHRYLFVIITRRVPLDMVGLPPYYGYMDNNSTPVAQAHTHYTTVTDGDQHLAQCKGCGERHYFRSEYFAKQWMNRHGQMVVRTYCTCH